MDALKGVLAGCAAIAGIAKKSIKTGLKWRVALAIKSVNMAEPG
tara:strand:- start:512 stop:643 length:132 start_codon:yes stop_codon:yes gene_type:complete